MITIQFKCDLCGKEATLVTSVGERVITPTGWLGREKGPSYSDFYGQTRRGEEFCCAEHRLAYQEAEKQACDEVQKAGLVLAQAAFAKKLRKLCLVAHSAVEALGNVVKDDE